MSNEPPHPKTQTPNLERDTREFIAVQDAIKEGRSVICGEHSAPPKPNS